MKKTVSSETDKPIKTILHKYCSSEWHPVLNQSQKQLSYKKGQVIFAQGDKVEGIYLVNNGRIKVSIVGKNKEERIIRLAGNNNIVGHRGIAISKYPITATALSDSSLVFLPKDIFVRLIKTNPELGLFMINFLADEIRDTEDRLVNLIQLEVRERIASILLTLIELFGFDDNEPTKLSYTLSRTDFASFAGTTYESVIRALFVLQKAKLIKLSGKNILITDVAGLKRMVQNSAR